MFCGETTIKRSQGGDPSAAELSPEPSASVPPQRTPVAILALVGAPPPSPSDSPSSPQSILERREETPERERGIPLKKPSPSGGWTTTLTLSPRLPFALFNAIARTSSKRVPIRNVSCSGLVSGIVNFTEALFVSPVVRRASTDSAAASTLHALRGGSGAAAERVSLLS